MKLFPYQKIRPEQDSLIKNIVLALENKKNLIIHAPTGLGKTAASLAPCLEFALKNKLTVFFLTSRHTQHTIAVETLKQIREKYNLAFHTADLVGKKNMCLQDGVSLISTGQFHEYCKKLREEDRCEFYLNTKKNSKNTTETDLMLGNLRQLGPKHTEDINELCKEENLCPYEIATLLAKESSVIISDYSYIFNPDVSRSLLRRIGKSLNECIVIVDEAHNLPKRVIDSATKKLTSFILRRAVQECNKYNFTESAVKLTTLMSSMAELVDYGKNNERLVSKEEFMTLVNEIQNYDGLINELEGNADFIREKQKSSFTGTVADFLAKWKGTDDGFTRIFSYNDQKMTLNYKCLDPSLITKDILKNIYCTIAMSGTLTPTEMYKDLLGFENAEEKVFKSPFPVENRLNLIVPKTTTKFTERNDAQFKKIADEVSQITNAVPGNSLVLFPSYFIRDNVYRYLSEKLDKTVFLEIPEMSKKDKVEMLSKFKSYSKTGAVLLGNSSGNFSEGIDLLGDLLKCVIIVGLPLQQPDLETHESIKYYDLKFQKGWDYGYVFPAFNKVLQGAGRCIRSETDRGVIIFLDERYCWPNYIRCFPEDMELKISKDYLNDINNFFRP